MPMFNPDEVRRDFPILFRKIEGNGLVYLDSGATSQKPKSVIEAVSKYYKEHNANVHRGAHTLGDESTDLLDESRSEVAKFIGADKSEVVFVRNATEAINLVAYSWGMENLKAGDRIVVTELEHHSNIVPWQLVAERTGAVVEFVWVSGEGYVDMGEFRSRVEGAKIVSFVHVSNFLGTISPVNEMVSFAKKAGAIVIVDGAQAIPHMSVNVRDLGVDFYVFSGHKMLGPMGIGVLYGRKVLLEQMPPFMGGGGMISEVYKSGSTYADVPEKFEAGTPNVAGAVGLTEAIRYLEKLGINDVREHDKKIVQYALDGLVKIGNIEILGPRDSNSRSGSVSFVYKGVHAHDVATILDSEGVAVRSGHHCTMVMHNKLQVPASVRASFNVYTNQQDIDRLIEALGKVSKVMGVK